MGPDDLQCQIAFIQGAFLTRVGTGHDDGRGQVRVTASVADEPAADELLTRELALVESNRLATMLHKLAIRSDDGGATWMGLAYSLPARQSSVRPLDLGLHDGHCGVALFLAALARITGEAAHRELALAALRPVRPSVGEPRLLDLTVRRIGIGGGLGLGSIVYSLVQISRLLDEPRLIADAAHFAVLISPQRVEEDDALDVVLGSAGAMLGLLKLHEATGDPAVLDRARLCGDHILARQRITDGRRGGWIGVEGRELSGFSHGASGIAYALTRLHAHTGEADVLEAARAGTTSERQFFVAEAGNWARSASPADRSPEHMRCTWCQGAAGIGLTRLGMLDTLDSEDIREDLEIGLRTTAAHALDATDHLCCGNLGRAEILFTAGERLGRASLQEAGLRTAGRVLRRARRTGEYAVEDKAGTYRHGFFQGSAGIGYTLLRMTHPGELAPVLLWA
jgi:type 2 lantibiotic biosynthesis protein LanM